MILTYFTVCIAIWAHLQTFAEMIIGILAIALECIYSPSRMLRTIALQKLIPSFIADSMKRPTTLGAHDYWRSWSCSDLHQSKREGNRFAIVALTFFRFRAAVKAQKATFFT
ncbi:hypothetical protein BDV11DRAFT_169693 [Aspergillus similis]